MVTIKLKEIIYEWFDYKSEDKVNRVCWIKKHIGENDISNCTMETEHNLYNNGIWKVE